MMLRSGEDSESESLVSREVVGTTSYTEEGGHGPDDTCQGDLREINYVDADVSVLSQFHQDALSQAGFGLFHWILFLVVGLGLAADSIEVFAIAYVLPSAEQDLCMDDVQKGWLAGISFVGMMIGGLVWGTLADKMGRRRTLISSLSTNAAFAIITAFMPTYGLFMVARLCSGIGVGGSLPVVFTYYSEFLVSKNRGRHLSWLLIFWAIGGVFAAIMAWAIIPRTGTLSIDVGQVTFHSWRVFLLVCALPATLSVIGLVFLPESPRYLLEVGRDVEAMFIYQRIFKLNHGNSPGAEYPLSELELPSRRPLSSFSTSSDRGLLMELLEALETFWSSFVQILWPPYTKLTLVLLVVWVTTSFGFYGMTIWFPEYMKRLDAAVYSGKAVRRNNTAIYNRTFNHSLENTNFDEVVFSDVHFSGVLLSHCVFDNCTFVNCKFTDVRSSRTFFHDSEFLKVRFVNTDLFDYRFHGCVFSNSTFVNTRTGCTVDFDVNFSYYDIFFENLIAQLAIIPGNIVSSYVLDRMGRVRTLGTSLFMTSVSAFFIWFLDSRKAVIIFEAVFNFISISGWNAVDVITTESYPTPLRGTGYGFLSAVSRLSAVLGTVSFGTFISVSKAVPILTTAAVLLVGGIFSVKLPETKDSLL